MTIKEIRSEYKRMRRFNQLIGGDLLGYLDSIWGSMEDLYKYGYIEEYSNEFLALVNGYVVTQQKCDRVHIGQTLDLHYIAANKSATREFMIYWLGC